MPKTTLFEVDCTIVEEYLEVMFGEDYEDNDEVDFDPRDFIKPGMTLMMNYTQTKNYKSEEASVMVKVESIRTVIEDTHIYIIGCVLRTDVPIFICKYSAYLGRSITLHTDTTTIAKGGVKHFLD
jgi:hypothetical protein